tara:strand:+ start:68 stop:235 length:168 start_codon:yes stop_codon:yes gene_type:complete
VLTGSTLRRCAAQPEGVQGLGGLRGRFVSFSAAAVLHFLMDFLVLGCEAFPALIF